MTPLAWFAVKLLAMLVPLAALAWFGRIFPHRPLVLLAVAPAVGSLVLFASPALAPPLAIVDLLVVAVAACDLFSLPRAATFALERQMGRVASLKHPHPVSLSISNLGARAGFIWLKDDADEELRPEPDQFRLRLAPRSRATLDYQLRPSRRGAFAFRKAYLHARSRWGLWMRQLDYPLEGVLHVYPDLKQLAEYALLARTNRLSLMGVRHTRRVGQDNEFERLRDYTPDDNYKHIDWRSTARRRKLTVKDFQASQSQRIVFLLDCGRMMVNETAGLSLLDHALNATLLLGYVALSHGDSVGLLCFSDEIHSYVPPGGGMRQMNRLLHATFDRFPRLVESRYDQAFVYLGTHCRKRSLVVLVSNIIDEVNAQQVERHLATVAGQHLPLGVLLRDRRLFEAVEAEQPDREALFRAAAAADILSWRSQVLADMHTKGVLSLDVFPEELTAPLVNRYLEIKARHLL